MLTGYVGDAPAKQVERIHKDGLINIELENGTRWFGVSPSFLKSEPETRRQLNSAVHLEGTVSTDAEPIDDGLVTVVEFPIIEESRPYDSASISQKKEVQVKERRFHEPVPATIDATLLHFLTVNKSEVNIRLHWSELIDDKVRGYFQRNGLEQATSNIRPLKSEQYGLAGTVDFPLPPSFLMKRLGVDFKEKKGKVVINNVEYALGLVLLGFEPNKSAKF